MGKAPHRPTKCRIEVSEKICSLYEQGLFTIESCCAIYGVKYCTFQSWAQPGLTPEDLELGHFRKGFVHEVHDLYLEAIDTYNQNYLNFLRQVVRMGLLRCANGFEIIEKSTRTKFDDHGMPIVTTVTTNKKFIPPNPKVITFLTENFNLLPS